jgi:hypothetical protein
MVRFVVQVVKGLSSKQETLSVQSLVLCKKEKKKKKGKKQSPIPVTHKVQVIFVIRNFKCQNNHSRRFSSALR